MDTKLGVMPQDILHFGIKGMKWGIRRYQNKDGSLTALGRERYRTADDPYGLHKGDLDPNDDDVRERFSAEKREIAKKYIDEDFSGKARDKQIQYETDLELAWNKAYFCIPEIDDVEKLNKDYNYHQYDSPYAHKAGASQNRFLREEASPRLQQALKDMANDFKASMFPSSFMKKRGCECEYTLLLRAYDGAYYDQISSKVDNKRIRTASDKWENRQLKYYDEEDERYLAEQEKKTIEHSDKSVAMTEDLYNKMLRTYVENKPYGSSLEARGDCALSPDTPFAKLDSSKVTTDSFANQKIFNRPLVDLVNRFSLTIGKMYFQKNRRNPT